MSEIRKERTRELYIDITCDLIRKEGMNAVSIRAVSERAGYNSATMYSYFDNLSHLVFCAYMRFEEEMMERFRNEIEKEKNLSLYQIWPHMYVIMADYYLENPNVFDCGFTSSYAYKDDFDGKGKRVKESVFNKYVIEKLNGIADETGKDLKLILKINAICLAEITGTVLLLIKKRENPVNLQISGEMEDNLRKIIHCFMEVE